MNHSFKLFISLLLIIGIMFECVLSCHMDYERRIEMIHGKTYIYCCIGCKKVYQDDIILSGSCCDNDDEDNKYNTDNQRRLSPSINNRNKYWPNGQIPYTIDSLSIGTYLEWVIDAIKYWNDNTNINLYPRINDEELNYVHFQNDGSGCNSYIGMIGGKQNINIANCGLRGVLHEIGHAVGLHHTQARQDRDLYVKMHWNLMDPNAYDSYIQVNNNYDDCLKYDYNSVMHYSQYSDHLIPGTITIETINPPNSKISTDPILSTLDIACVNSLYSPCRISLYQEDFFKGASYSPLGTINYHNGDIYYGHYYLSQLLGSEFNNDQISSMLIMIDPGFECYVVLPDLDFEIEIIANNSRGQEYKTFGYTLKQLQSYGYKDNSMNEILIYASKHQF